MSSNKVHHSDVWAYCTYSYIQTDSSSEWKKHSPLIWGCPHMAVWQESLTWLNFCWTPTQQQQHNCTATWTLCFHRLSGDCCDKNCDKRYIINLCKVFGHLINLRTLGPVPKLDFQDHNSCLSCTWGSIHPKTAVPHSPLHCFNVELSLGWTLLRVASKRTRSPGTDTEIQLKDLMQRLLLLVTELTVSCQFFTHSVG